MNRTFHTFQTGRLYTVNGQRCAWTVLPSGNVAFYDLDRMIDYVFSFRPDVRLTNADIQHAYDNHGRDNDRTAPYNDADYRLARDLQSALIEAARTAPTLAEWSRGRQMTGMR